MSLGVLASELPREAVDEVVAAHSKQPRRRGSKLPAHVMVYFALALGLWSGDDYEQVMAQLTDRLGGLGGWEAGRPRPRAGSPRSVGGWSPEYSRICTSDWPSRSRRSLPRGLGRETAACARGRHLGRPARHPRQRRVLRLAGQRRRAGPVPTGQDLGTGRGRKAQ
ncbi:transposase domain-containing protein [Streptomyces spongiicola]|uniref:transposase domain-containing protein n=1 Tax=Streptomyces spongiicola TaxID=1690221 RepID=UPI000E2FB1AB